MTETVRQLARAELARRRDITTRRLIWETRGPPKHVRTLDALRDDVARAIMGGELMVTLAGGKTLEGLLSDLNVALKELEP